jgi:DNA-binding CsgD family transcriptional regulator
MERPQHGPLALRSTGAPYFAVTEGGARQSSCTDTDFVRSVRGARRQVRSRAVSKRDPIALVEACYALRSTEEQWLQAIADAARPLMRAPTVIAYHVDIDDKGIHIDRVVQSGEGMGDVAGQLRAYGEGYGRRRAGTASAQDHETLSVIDRIVGAQLREPVDRMLMSEMQSCGPRWAYTLGKSVRELCFLINHHIDGHGATYIVGPRDKPGLMHASERLQYQKLSAHIKAGLRLRRRLGELMQGAPKVSEGGAVLDAAAKVVHADGDAREDDARQALEQRAREIDRARTREGGRDEHALEVWQGLISGRWSLVERFDSDGKRFMLAHKNAEDVADPRGLTALEARVTGLAVRGYSDKLIAYHLGVAESTASVQLASALRKLGIRSRVELVRTLGGGELS